MYNDRKYDLEQSYKKVKEELRERLDRWKTELCEEQEASRAEIETRWQLTESGKTILQFGWMKF